MRQLEALKKYLLIGYSITITIIAVWFTIQNRQLIADSGAYLRSDSPAKLLERMRSEYASSHMKWTTLKHDRHLNILFGEPFDTNQLGSYWMSRCGNYVFILKPNGEIRIQAQLPTKTTESNSR